MAWRLLRVRTPAHRLAALEQLLLDAGALSVTLADAQDQPLFQTEPGTTPLWDELILTGLFEADTDLQPLLWQLEHQSDETPIWFHMEELADQDWARSWMTQYQPLRFGSRLWVCPSWTQPPDANAINLRLDPGLAFGTGTHPTTAMCLEWLDQAELAGATVIDYGCGSGVLAIAARLLGATSVIAVDNDPQALRASEANRALNEIDAATLRCCSPEALMATEAEALPADVLVANILSGPLEQLAPLFAELVRPGGSLVLSGILPGQAGSLVTLYDRWFHMLAPLERDGWTRLAGSRR